MHSCNVENRMSTEEEVNVRELGHEAVDMQRVAADALMAENVRVRKLALCRFWVIQGAEALRDAL
jgi:hypothetical protein